MFMIHSVVAVCAVLVATQSRGSDAEQPDADQSLARSIRRELGGSRQLLVVTSDGWDVVSAELRCFERPDLGSRWTEAFTVADVVLGRNGLGWGVGLHGQSAGDGPSKREGDGRAPAGVFRLVEVFGYAPADEAGVANFPYRHLTEEVEGVDDPASRHYNRLVDAHAVAAKDWTSSERMRHSGEVYRWGVVVAHNWDQIPGAGSCIFLHIWERAGAGSSGCTAMPAEQMLKVVRWLNRRKRPLLVQLPKAEYQRLRGQWGLP